MYLETNYVAYRNFIDVTSFRFLFAVSDAQRFVDIQEEELKNPQPPPRKSPQCRLLILERDQNFLLVTHMLTCKRQHLVVQFWNFMPRTCK